MADDMNARFKATHAQLRMEDPDMDRQTAAYIAKTVVLDNQAKDAKPSQLHKDSPGGPNIRVETSAKPSKQMVQIGGHDLTLNQRLHRPSVRPGGDDATMRNQEASMDRPNLATQNYTVPLPSTGLGSERYRQPSRPTQLPATGGTEPIHTRNPERQQENTAREPYPPSTDRQASMPWDCDNPHPGHMRTEARLPSEFHAHTNGQIPQTHVPLGPSRRSPLNDLPANVFNSHWRNEAPQDRPATDRWIDPSQFTEDGNNDPPPPYNDQTPSRVPCGIRTPPAEPEIVEPPPSPLEDPNNPNKSHAKKGRTPKSKTNKIFAHIRRHI